VSVLRIVRLTLVAAYACAGSFFSSIIPHAVTAQLPRFLMRLVSIRKWTGKDRSEFSFSRGRLPRNNSTECATYTFLFAFFAVAPSPARRSTALRLRKIILPLCFMLISIETKTHDCHRTRESAFLLFILMGFTYKDANKF
jgi:hypothetical protein